MLKQPIFRSKGGKIHSKKGDIVAISAKIGEYFIAIIVQKNAFGTAYGIFTSTYVKEPILDMVNAIKKAA